MPLPRPVFRFKEANSLTDYAKKEHYLSWLRHPVLGDPSFDTFEKLGETVHKSQPPYEWAVNGSLFRDPKDGACYLFAGLYAHGYAVREEARSRFFIYRSLDNCQHFEPLGFGFEKGFQFQGHPTPTASYPDAVMAYDRRLDKYLLAYDWSDEGFSWETAHQQARIDSGSALAWAESPSGPFHRYDTPIFSCIKSFGRLGKFDRGYATTVIPRERDYLALVLLDSGRHFAWALAALTAPAPEGPWSEPHLVLSPETDLYYPAPVEFYPCYQHEGKLYAPATSVAGNRNYQALFACDVERAHIPSAWKLESDGSVWHGRALEDERYGIWGQTYNGFVHDNQLTVVYPSKDSRDYGTLSVARRPWDMPIQDGFTFSGHAAPSVAPLLKSVQDFSLNARVAVTGRVAVYFDYQGVLGPDRICSDAAPHPMSRRCTNLLQMDERGRYALIHRDASGTDQVLLSGAMDSPIRQIALRRTGHQAVLSLNGKALGSAEMPASGGVLALGADCFSILKCDSFELEGDERAGSLCYCAQEALLNAGQLADDWQVVPGAGFRGTDLFTGQGTVRAKWNFLGDGFTLCAPQGPELGDMLVYLDGALAASLPLKSERPAPSKPLFHLDGLDLGPHAVVLRPKGGKIAVDALIAQWRPQVV